MKRQLSVVFVVIVALGLSAYLFFLIHGDKQRDIGSVVRKYGFTEVIPPTRLFRPGALVTIVQTNPLIIDVTCTELSSLGASMGTRLISSDSENAKETAELSGSFTLSGSFFQNLETSFDSKFVRKVVVTLSNVKITEIPDDAVIDLVKNRTAGCISAVELRRAKGKTISMIKSIIEANVTYHVEFTGEANSQTKAKMTREFAGTLGLTDGIKSDDVIQGDGLIWGVRDDVDLAALSIAALTNGPPATTGLEHRHALSTNESIQVKL